MNKEKPPKRSLKRKTPDIIRCFSLVEISGIEALTFPAVNAGKPPAAGVIEMQEVSGVRMAASPNKKPRTKVLGFCLVEISGIEPLTFPAVNAGKPPSAAMIEMQEVSGVRTANFTK